MPNPMSGTEEVKDAACLPNDWRALNGANGPMAAGPGGRRTVELDASGTFWLTDVAQGTIPVASSIIVNLLRRAGWTVTMKPADAGEEETRG